MIGLILLQIALIALNAIFAGTEIAVISVNETKLEKEVESGNKRAGWLLKILWISRHHPGCYYPFRISGRCIRIRQFRRKADLAAAKNRHRHQ